MGIRPLSNGMFAWPCSAAWPSTVRGSPTKFLMNGRPKLISGVPKPILKAHRTQVIRTRQKVVNTMSTVFMAHFFCTRPP